MTERIRNAKELEQAYGAGFIDGLQHALDEVRAERERERGREQTIVRGFGKLRDELSQKPKRERKRRKLTEPPLPLAPGLMNFHTTSFFGVTSNTVPDAPEQISVLPLGRR